MKILFLLLIILAIPTLAQAQNEAALEAAGCGPKDIQFDVKTDKKTHPKGQVEPGKALIYVFDNIGGVAIGKFPASRVGVDGTWVGANYKKSYFFFSVAPGAHNLCVDRMVTSFTAEAGQTRYFAVGLPLYPDGFYKVNEISPAEAELQIGSLAYSTFTQKPTK
jgi:Protein of unknown function (DUF2846)